MSAIASHSRASLRRERSRAGPSHASKRVASAALALLGAVIAARLTAYQMGWTAPPWEPLFGDGSQRVLHSSFSRALPFPDAGLGLVAYVAEIVTLAWGSTARWRSDPLAVYAYASIAFGMALGSAGLVILQLTVIHAFCTLCVTSALISFALVMPAASELIATWKARGSR
jgi:uncharacterized membrane protein